jgi:hypothetical protein
MMFFKDQSTHHQIIFSSSLFLTLSLSLFNKLQKWKGKGIHTPKNLIFKVTKQPLESQILNIRDPQNLTNT